MVNVAILLLASMLAPLALWAECGDGRIRVWPKSDHIAVDQVFTIEGDQSMQRIIRNLGQAYRPVLTNGSTTIDLKVIARYEGDMVQSEVVMKATLPLAIGSTYEFAVLGLPEGLKQPLRWNPDTQLGERIRWTVSPMKQALVTLLPEPRETKKTLVPYGCGTAERVYLEVAPAYEPTGLVLATVIEKNSRRRTSYVLLVESGQLQLGHGMCSGEFTFTKGESYSVSFDVIGHDGLTMGRPTPPVVFTPPVVMTDEE